MVLSPMKKNLLIFLLPAFFASAACGQSVSFYKENLLMKLDASHITVIGEYSFRNNYGVETNQTIFFPLPLAKGELKIDSISVFDESSQTYIRNIRKLPAGLFFQLTFHGLEQKKLRIFYVMDHDGKTVHYLVMTHVQYWKKPLSLGIYTLQVEDPSITIDSTSYKPDEVLADNAKRIHTWRKVNFNPDKELDIWFHRR
jgi:hypothetical protein